MVIRIHGTYKDGTEDYIDIEDDDLEVLRIIAKEEAEKRGWDNCWSEEIKQ